SLMASLFVIEFLSTTWYSETFPGSSDCSRNLRVNEGSSVKRFSIYELAVPMLYPREPLSHRIIVDFCLKNAFSAIIKQIQRVNSRIKDLFEHLQLELLSAMDAGESSGCGLEI
ncbi:MAG: hypothetical protein VX867_05660, partial [Pseudomonadota bacterium]|nr:hypothetical protein [Pseudomonadota bacterium]